MGSQAPAHSPYNRQTLSRDLFIVFLLVASTLLVFGQVARHDFVKFDDDIYVVDNEMVHKGLTAENLVEALIHPHIGHWHPLTWYSHMIDYDLYGLDASGHHLTNLAFHLLNTLLLFLLLRWLTAAPWCTALVAVLFAIHPLHVEPVAWVSSRKDVLSTFFWLLTLLTYAAYTKKPNALRYVASLLFFILGLMAKPMVITLPITLLLFDFWPLKRTQGEKSARMGAWRKLVAEKIPFFTLSILSALMTYTAARQGGAVRTFDQIAFINRLANPPVYYLKYIFKTLWPTRLAVPYPLDSDVYPAATVGLAVLLLLGLTVAAYFLRGRAPHFIVGWLWFLATLAPVIGFIQIGGHAIADRYTYVPLIGLFIAGAWTLKETTASMAHGRLVSVCVALPFILVSGYLAWVQSGYWKNTEALFRHTLKISEANYTAHTNLATALMEDGRVTEAKHHLTRAIEISPTGVSAHVQLGRLLKQEGNREEAFTQFTAALNAEPDNIVTRNNMAALLMELNRFGEAQVHLDEAMRIDPNDLDTRNNMGNLLLTLGKLREAEGHYIFVLEFDPERVSTLSNLGALRLMDGNYEDAASAFTKALTLDPNDAEVRVNYALALLELGQLDRALEECRRAIEVDPTYQKAHALMRLLKTKISK